MGKFEKKKNTKRTAGRQSRKSGKLWWLVVAILLMVAIVAMLLLKKDGDNTPMENQPAHSGIVVEHATDPQSQPGQQEILIDLGQKLYVTDIGSYAGLFVEDGTDEMVQNVLMIRIVNKGSKTVEYMEISIPTSQGTAKFSVSTLPAGATVIVQEKNRMPYSAEEDYSGIQADFAAFFEEPLSLSEDVLKIQKLDGAMNITNLTDEDIAGPVRIYYKNWSDDIFYGGITYRITLEDGLKAGELRQIMASHFYQNSSTILSVVCEGNG